MDVICNPSTSYYSTPEFLTRTCHLITAISTPIHILGLYLILFKTPKQMKSVKWYFVNLHSWILLYDYSLGVLTIPYLLLPTMSGYTLGVLTNTGLSEFYMVVLVLLACTYVLLSMLAIFENRLHIICDYFWMRYWNKIRMPWIIGHYVVGFLIFIPMKSFIPEQEPAKKVVFEKLTCLPDYVHDAPVFVLAETYTYHLIALVSLLVSGCIEAGIIINCLNFFIVRQLKRKRISRVTLKLQIKFLIVISIQMLVPALLMVIPLTYSWVCIVYNYYNQAIMNIVIAMETMHGLFSTLTMIFIHHPYRTAVFNMFPKWSKRVAPGENTSMFQNGSAFPTIN